MRKYPVLLFWIYLVIWAVLAVNPNDRFDWFLENLLVFISVPFFIWSYKKFRLSNLSYTLITLFMILHAVGSHYLYAEVPFGFWIQEIFDLSRNHFDRIVHFSYGLLLSYPIRELFLKLSSTKGAWAYWFPVELTLAFSAVYEILEWGVAVIVAPEAGIAFLGVQGDQWDAQKDMALAGLGAVMAMSITALGKTYKRRS